MGCGQGFGCRPDLSSCKCKPSHMFLPRGLERKGGTGRREGHPPGGQLIPGKCRTRLSPCLWATTQFSSVFSSTNSLGKPLLLNWGLPTPFIPHSVLLCIWEPASAQQLSTKSGSICAMQAHFLAFILSNQISLFSNHLDDTSLKNANKNYDEVSTHTGQNDHHQKVYKQQMLEKVWRKGNLFILLVRMQTIQPLWRTEWGFL